MNALSLFSNAGFGEFYLPKIGVNIVTCNELLQDRLDLYKKLHRSSGDLVCGDIGNDDVKNSIISSCQKQGGIDLIIATPPCQGMSIANAKKSPNDIRNKLIIHAMDIFSELDARYMLIENVPQMAKTYINYKGQAVNIIDFIQSQIPNNFKCFTRVLNGKKFGTAQSRSRSISLISKNGAWIHPKEFKNTPTVRDAIGNNKEFCSLESGQHSLIPWHFASRHNKNHIEWMSNTREGCTAFDNEIHYPSVLENGKKRRIHGFKTTYKRMKWDEPAPTVTMTNGSISSQNNVHPGILKNGRWTDARVLTIREILAICGLPSGCFDKFATTTDGNTYTYDFTPNFMRKVLGEMFLPKMCLEIIKMIPELK